MNFAQLDPADGDPIPRRAIDDVLTAGDFVFDDGATQTFRPNGTTTYVESGRPTEGEWYVEEDGRFCSFWPPAYTGCYNLKWLVEHGETAGVRFVEVDTGREFNGRYISKKT